MVLFYDLSAGHRASASTTAAATARERLNRQHPLSRLLAAYPFLAGVARWLDHTDLENLSSACWQFRDNMAQHRGVLLRASLRCCVEGGAGWSAGGYGDRRGREAVCVRDMVRACRRCGWTYCRNCIHKPTKSTFNCRTVAPCTTCRLAPTHQITPAPCTCDATTWICQSCVNSRWYCGGGRLCPLCSKARTEPSREDMVAERQARKACTWCYKVVWSAEDLEVLGEGAAAAAATGGEEEEGMGAL